VKQLNNYQLCYAECHLRMKHNTLS